MCARRGRGAIEICLSEKDWETLLLTLKMCGLSSSKNIFLL